MRPSRTGSGVLATIVTLILGAGVAWVLLQVVFWYCLSRELATRGGSAPDDSISVCQHWGENVFGAYLAIVSDWIRQSQFIQADLGEVLRVAPTGGPNRLYPGFTDGGYAQMRLEIVGAVGKGVLTLPYVEIDSMKRVQQIGEDAEWEYEGVPHIIDSSGRGYLSTYGLKKVYQNLLKLSNALRHEEFLALWPQLEQALADSALPRPVSPTGQESTRIQQLHDRYREELLEMFGQAQSAVDLPGGQNLAFAVESYQLAATSILHRAKDKMRQDADLNRSRVEADLRQANRVLGKAHALDPDHPHTLRLARKRALLRYLFTRRIPPSPPFTQDSDEIEAWNNLCLGVLYREGMAYPERSDYLARTLGAYRMQPDLKNDSALFINRHNQFAADVRLHLKGPKGEGQLIVFIREKDDEQRQIDLFSDDIRDPDYPLTLRSPSWYVHGETHVSLGAKTGEPK